MQRVTALQQNKSCDEKAQKVVDIYQCLLFGNDVLHRGCVNTEKKITTITIIINLFPLDLSHHNHDPNIQNIENVIHVVLWVYPIVSLVVALDSFWS